MVDVGEAKKEGDGRLRLPGVGSASGLYRFTIEAGGIVQCYVGESNNLRRRFKEYGAEGDGKDTNKRIRNALLRALDAKGVVAVEVATREAWLCRKSSCERANLVSKKSRALFERLAIFEHGCDLNDPQRRGFDY